MHTLSQYLGTQIAAELEDGIRVQKLVIEEQIAALDEIARLVISALQDGRKVLIFGNGGSAADSQHIAGELVGKFRRVRQALPAIALTTDTSVLTSIGNDCGFEYVFSRQIEALGNEGDIAIGISTSGNSRNVINGLRTARAMRLTTIGFTGQDGGELKEWVDVCFQVPSQSTPHIQEAHIAVAHALCELVEREFVQAGV